MRRFQSSPKYAWLPLLIATMTAVAALIGWLAFHTVESRQVASNGDSLALAASAIADDLDLFLDERLGYLSVAASTLVFKQHDPAAMNEYLKAVRSASHNTFLWLGATDAAGRIIASTEPSVLGQDRGNSVWFQAVRGTRMTSVGDVGTFTESGGAEAMSLAVPITDPQGTFLGTVAAQMGIPALEEVVTRTIRSAEGQRYLPGTFEYQFLLRDGFAFVDSDLLHKGNVNLKHLGLRSAFLAESGQPGYLEEEHLRRHVPVVTGYARTQGRVGSADLQWSILLRMGRNEILAPTRAALQNLTIVGAVVWLPMFMLLLWTNRRLRMEWRQAQDESVHAKAAEAALRESEARFRLLADTAPVMMWMSGPDALCTDFNKPWLDFTGRTLEQELGNGWAEGVHLDDLPRCLEGYLAAFHARLPFALEFRTRRADGEYRWILDQGVPRQSADGRFAGYIGAGFDITDRKKTEEALRQSEGRYRQLIEACQDAIYVLDSNGIFLSTNQAGRELFGYTEQELIGMPVLETYLPEERPVVAERLQRIKTGVPLRYERVAVRKDGATVPIEVSLSPMTHGRYQAVVRDITYRKRTEEKLLLSHEIITNAHDPISIMDLQGHFTYQNPAHAFLLGFSDEELLGKSPAVFLGKETFASICRQLARTQSYRGEVSARTKAGVPKDLELSVFTIRDAAEKPTCLVAIQRDITERKKAEDALRANEQRVRAILDGALDAVVGMDAQGIITDWNPRAEGIFGWSRGEAIGRYLAESIIPTQYRERHRQGLKRLLDTGESSMLNRRVEITAIRRDGTEFPVELAISALKDWAGYRFTAFISDISERKKTEETQKKLIAELDESRSRFEMFFHKTPSAIAITTVKEGRFLEVNEKAERLTGYSRKELLGRTILELGLYPDPAVRTKIMAQLKEKGVLADLERPIRTKSGETRTAIFSLVLIQMGHEPCVLSIAHDITERRRTQEALRVSEQTLRMVLNEREQLSQDLHDGLIQSLYAIGMSMEECRRLTEEDPDKSMQKLGQLIGDINGVIREVRSHLIEGEHDMPLTPSQLKAELARVAGAMERANALHFRLKVDQRAATVLTTEERKEILYIAQEAMSNCLRHSGASVANVSLQLWQNHVRLEVEDDGVGFDREAVLASTSGLRNIEQRAAKVGATIAIVSRREHGTRIRLDIPIHAQSGSRP